AAARRIRRLQRMGARSGRADPGSHARAPARPRVQRQHGRADLAAGIRLRSGRRARGGGLSARRDRDRRAHGAGPRGPVRARQSPSRSAGCGGGVLRSRATLSRGLRRPERPHSMFMRRTPLVLVLLAVLAAPLSASADTTFTFTGHGYGHGVGMGQYGAQGYALQGWTHQQILAHYYQSTTLGPSGVTQVRVLLQEKATQASASAPGGVTATDEGGSAKLVVPGSGVVKVRKAPGGFTLLDASGTVLDRGWVGPVSLTATGGGPITLNGA